MTDLQPNDGPKFKLGIIGCGQVGTSFLTKLLEVKEQFHNLEIWVSTRQPHLLRPFKQEFGIHVFFDNAKIAANCDLIFLCCLPNQTQEVFKDIREILSERAALSITDSKYINPLVVSTCAAMSYPKLRQSLKSALLLRTSIDVSMLREYLFKAQTIARNGETSAEIDKWKQNEEQFKYMDRVLS